MTMMTSIPLTEVNGMCVALQTNSPPNAPVMPTLDGYGDSKMKLTKMVPVPWYLMI